MWSNFVKRRAMKLVLFLLVGAIINVAVAWGCAAWIETNQFPEDPYRSAQHGWKIKRGSGVGLTWSTVQAWKPADQLPVFDELDDEIAAAMSKSRPPERAFVGLEKTDSGWPSPALTFVKQRYYHDANLTSVNEVKCGLDIRSGRTLPLLPLWPGFAINTIFYAAVLWVLFAVPGRVRRWRRIKRGVCVQCAYPLGSSSVCSECGTAVHGASPPATPA